MILTRRQAYKKARNVLNILPHKENWKVYVNNYLEDGWDWTLENKKMDFHISSHNYEPYEYYAVTFVDGHRYISSSFKNPLDTLKDLERRIKEGIESMQKYLRLSKRYI